MLLVFIKTLTVLSLKMNVIDPDLRKALDLIQLLFRKQYAIPAGGIDSDIGDTLSVSSFGSRGTRASRASGRGESGIEIYRYFVFGYRSIVYSLVLGAPELLGLVAEGNQV